jgi:hypothetical protein
MIKFRKAVKVQRWRRLVRKLTKWMKHKYQRSFFSPWWSFRLNRRACLTYGMLPKQHCLQPDPDLDPVFALATIARARVCVCVCVCVCELYNKNTNIHKISKQLITVFCWRFRDFGTHCLLYPVKINSFTALSLYPATFWNAFIADDEGCICLLYTLAPARARSFLYSVWGPHSLTNEYRG